MNGEILSSMSISITNPLIYFRCLEKQPCSRTDSTKSSGGFDNGAYEGEDDGYATVVDGKRAVSLRNFEKFAQRERLANYYAKTRLIAHMSCPISVVVPGKRHIKKPPEMRNTLAGIRFSMLKNCGIFFLLKCKENIN